MFALTIAAYNMKSAAPKGGKCRIGKVNLRNERLNVQVEEVDKNYDLHSVIFSSHAYSTIHPAHQNEE